MCDMMTIQWQSEASHAEDPGHCQGWNYSFTKTTQLNQMTDHFLFPAIVKLNMSFFISSHTHPLWRQSDENHDLIKILQKKFNVD